MRRPSPILLVFTVTLVTVFCGKRRYKEVVDDRIFIKDAKKNPAFLIGRLPGKNWREHNPARFNALQSFETEAKVEKAVLALYMAVAGQQDSKAFLRTIVEKIKTSNTRIEYEPVLKTSEGDWQSVLLENDRGLIRLYASRKGKRIFWLQYIAPTAEVFALYSPDVKSYVRQFWFLYR